METGVLNWIELRGDDVVDDDTLGDSMLRLGFENTVEIRRERRGPVLFVSNWSKRSSVARLAARSCTNIRIWITRGLLRSHNHSIMDHAM